MIGHFLSATIVDTAKKNRPVWITFHARSAKMESVISAINRGATHLVMHRYYDCYDGLDYDIENIHLPQTVKILTISVSGEDISIEVDVADDLGDFQTTRFYGYELEKCFKPIDYKAIKLELF